MHGSRVLEVHEIDAVNEQAAVKEARLRAAGHSYELWREERRIASFHAEDDLSSVIEKARKHPTRSAINAHTASQK
jgi:hypothetical protein